MARVCRHYRPQDFTGLLAELQNAGAEAGKLQPVPEEAKPAEPIAYISPEARKRASLMGNPRMRYAYSRIDNTIHDRDCEALKAIQDQDFRMLSDFDTQRPICKRCYRRAVIRSGIGDDVKFINAYVRIFERMHAAVSDLKELILEHGARLSAIDLDRVAIKVHDDRWMICLVNDRLRLYHNNYSVTEDYQRLFHAGYHVQNDGGTHTFHNFTHIMLSYSWDKHVARLKAKALAELQAKLRARLTSTDNWLRVPRFSLFHSYCAVVDCNRRLGRFVRKNGMKYCVVDRVQEPGSPYRLGTCRIKRRQKKMFCAAMDALKEYSVVSGYHDYADECGRMLQRLLEQNRASTARNGDLPQG